MGAAACVIAEAEAEAKGRNGYIIILSENRKTRPDGQVSTS